MSNTVQKTLATELQNFATLVATDIKTLTNTKANKTEVVNESKVNELLDALRQELNGSINAAKSDVKDELLGGASAEFDTLKELKDYFTNNQDVGAGVIEKIAEVKRLFGDGITAENTATQQLQALTARVDGLAVGDLVSVYNQAKTA